MEYVTNKGWKNKKGTEKKEKIYKISCNCRKNVVL